MDDYAEVRQSFVLAMKAEGVDPETRETVARTVDDAVGNL